MQSDKRWPVAEVFGPTIQGEGLDQGAPCHFIRFGGCDYKCGWCDSPFAVLPEEVRKAERLNADEIMERVSALGSKPRWMILSGGNPAMHDLEPLVRKLKDDGYLVATETQGSLWKPWLGQLNRLCISFKPPSSGMGDKSTVFSAKRFLDLAKEAYRMDFAHRVFVKIVVFDSDDLEFARQIHSLLPWNMRLYLSAGNDPGQSIAHPEREDNRTVNEVRANLLDSASVLAHAILEHPLGRASNVFVQCQYHTLLWGNGKGF